MTSGQYAVLRFVPDPARNEPLNVGIIVSGPDGSAFWTGPSVEQRMLEADPSLEPAAFSELQDYLKEALNTLLVRVELGVVQRMKPSDRGFLGALRDQLPRRFTLTEPRTIEFSDAIGETLDDVATVLLKQFVASVPQPVGVS